MRDVESVQDVRPRDGIAQAGFLICMLVVAYLATHIYRLLLHPLVWNDEIQCLEPAIRILAGYGFTSAGHDYVALGDFMPGPPVYYYALAGWMQVFGDSMVSVRAFAIAIGLISVCLPLHALLRSSILRMDVLLLLSLLMLLMGQPLTVVVQSMRYDLAALLILALAFPLMLGGRKEVAQVIAALAGGALVWSNFTVAASFVAFLIGYALIVDRRQWGLAAGALFGSVIGSVSFLALLYYFDAMSDFQASLAHSSRGWSTTGLIVASLKSVIYDRSAILLIVLGMFAIWWLRRSRDQGWRLALLAVGWLVIAPIVLVNLLHLTFYYQWVIILPALFMLAIVLQRCEGKRFVTAVFVVAVVLSVASGMGQTVILATLEHDERNPDRLEQFVQQNLESVGIKRSESIVLTDASTYYAVNATRVRHVYSGGAKQFSSDVAESIDLAFLDTASVRYRFGDSSRDSAWLQAYLGGDWKLDQTLTVERSALRQRLAPAKRNTLFDVQVYRRVKE